MVTIVEIVQLTSLFSIFVDEEYNGRLLEEVSKNELMEVMHNFKKDKSLGPCGGLVEFFIVFYELIKEDLVRVIDESRVNGRIYSFQ